MNEEPIDHQPPTSPQLQWPAYLLLTATTGASAALSYLIAAFSGSQVVVQVSIGTSIVCFLFVLKLAADNRPLPAFLLSLATAPIAIFLAFSYVNTQSIRTELSQELAALGHSAVAKVVDPQPALDRAIQEGSIRRATVQDLEAFRDAYIKKKYSKNNQAEAEKDDALSVTRVDVSRAYVVLKKFTYPSGLVNQYRAVFFIPTGVPDPIGKYGHSAIYRFDTLTVECTLARAGGLSC